MNSLLAAAVLAASTVSAHSWLECTNHDNSQMIPWMQGNSTLNPPVIIDPAMPWYSNFCHGWPRNKANPGNWIDDSSNYAYNIGANSWNGGSYHPPDTHACPPHQRSPTYQGNAPMSTASPGSMIRLRFGGNGHTRGANVGGDPGTVTVYWKGGPEREIVDMSDFTPANTLQTAGFAEKSFSYPADPNVKTPIQGLVDKGNWMELNLPKTMAPGRHMMVWVWYFKGAAQWSTCFDVMITGGGSAAPASPPPASPPPASPPPASPPPASPPPVSQPPPSPPPAVQPAPAPAPAAAAPAAPVVAPYNPQAPAPAPAKGGSGQVAPVAKAAVVLVASPTAPVFLVDASPVPAATASSPAVPSPKSTQINEAPDNNKATYKWWRAHPGRFRRL